MPFAPSSIEPIASRAAREAIARLRLENARRISALRVMAIGAAAAMFVGFGRVLGIADYRGGDGVLALELCAASVLYFWVRRSERVAAASAYALALIDVPALALIELSLVPQATNPEELVAFNAATMLVFVMAATLYLAKAPIITAAISASVCHGLLQLYTGGHPSHLASTAIMFGLAGALCTYAAYRMRGLVVAGALRGLELEGAERTLERQRHLLRASEERFRSLLDLAPDGAFIVRTGTVVYANRPLTELLEYESEGLSGRPVEALVVPQDRAHVLSPETAASGASEPCEVRLAMRGGEVRHVELVGRAIEVDGVASWLFMTRDLTERRVLQARLIGADRLASMGLLAAGVAHEINTPLAVVIASLEYLESELDAAASRETEELRAPLLDARAAAVQASEIVRDLRLFSRAEEARSANVRDALESAVRMASGELRQHARLERQLNEVPRVRASESRLAQVFLNLLNNAVEAFVPGTSDGNVVSLRAFTDHSGWAVVEVTDTGAGILPADLPRVFRPFFTTKHQGVGTGLGLAICERLVSEIGGRIEVETRVGRGSTFRVVLPPADPCAAEVAARDQSSAPSHLRPLRILVIDDDSAICRALSRLLGREEDVTALESSREARDLIAGGSRFDVIFCDVMMPNLPGAEFLGILRERWPDQAARVVLMTGGVLSGAGRAFLEENPGRLIEKPFTLAQIRRAIEGRIAECGLQSGSNDPSTESAAVEHLAP